MRKLANMEFRVLLWLLCIAYAFATVTSDAKTEDAELEVTKDSDSSATQLNKTDENGTNHNNSDNKPRDKRTLGMILTGLAGILGYTVSPIQAASLPNPTLPPTAARPAIPIPVFPVGIPAAPAPPPKAPAPPPQPPAPSKQRENVRLTGVVNFGNNGDLLGHLQQYEQIFHGAAAASSPAKPRPKPPIGPPILADIPSPIAPNLPAPYPPAPAPRPTKPLPLRTEYEVEYRNNQNIENYKVENKELKDETELTTPSSKYTHDIFIQEPSWKKNYDDRLAQLERQQEEYAERLTQHEAQTKPKEEEEEIVERYPNREKEIADRDREYAAKLREQEESKHEPDRRDYENDREEPREKNENYSQGKQYEDYSEEPARYRDYDNDSRNKYKEYTDYEEAPGKSSNQDHEEKLPIIRNDEDYKPEVPMNSYGESLERQGEIDENIADYFSKFKNPHTGMYDTDRIQNAGGEGEGSRWEQSLKDQERIRQEYSSPAPETRYEEYDLDDEEPRKENIKESENVENLDDDVGTTRETYVEQKTPDYSEAFGRYEPYSKNLEPEEGDHVLTSQSESGSPQESYRKDDSSEESRNDEQSEEPKRKPPPERYEFNFKNYNPYFAPIQYIYSKDELDDTTAKILSSYKNSETSEDDEQGSDEEESRKHIHEEELRPKIGLPEKLALKNLHEGEAKEINAWPAPFDYVFDSTEQTIVAQAKNSEQAPKSIPNQEPTYQTPYERPINHGPKSEDYKDQPEADDREDYKNYNQVPSADDVDNVSPRQGYVLKSTSSTPFYPNGGYLESFRAHDGPADHQERPAASSGPAPKNEESQRNRESQGEHYDGPGSFLDRYRYGFGDESSREEPPKFELQGHQPAEQEQGFQSASQPQKVPIQHSHASSVPEQVESKEQLHRDGPQYEHYYTKSVPQINGRRFDENSEGDQTQKTAENSKSEYKRKTPKKFDDPQSAHDFFEFSKEDYNIEKENSPLSSSSGVESTTASVSDKELGLLTIPEPAPYDYDAKLTEFTDGPETDTEKVKVKEYRNKVATLKVSELKQLGPNGPVHLIGYTHNF